MTNNTRHMTAAILTALGNPFDAHAVEQRILRDHPIEVGQELQHFRHKRDPLRVWSAQTAQWIDRQFRGQLRKTRKVKTPNLGGKPSWNQEWEKANPGAPIT